MQAWLFALAPALVAAIVIELARRSALADKLADHPNARSLHSQPTPRVGGIGIMVAALPFAAWTGEFGAAVGCAAALALVSLVDDRRGLPVEVRLPAHLVAALAFVLSLGGFGHVRFGGWELALVVLGLAWMANLYNFMDGADGIAGSMGAIGFFAYAVAAQDAGSTGLMLASLATGSACLGFLVFNLPPARVFLGDAGSIPLGFLAGALGLMGHATGVWPPWFPVLVFSPFIVDASVTLMRRALRREPVWRAHREHAYQRLVLAGWTRVRLLLAMQALMLAAAASALLARASGGQARCAIILAWAALYPLLLLAIERRTRKPGA